MLASRRGVEPLRVGKLPDHLAILNNTNAACEDLAVEGCLTGDKESVPCHLHGSTDISGAEPRRDQEYG